MASSKNILIYGGKGALGAKLVEFFKSQQYKVTSLDFHQNEAADVNITLGPNLGLEQQAKVVADAIPDGTQLDGIICVAGGWAGGNIASDAFLKNGQLMLEQSLWTSYISASLVPKYLKPGGLLVLTGAQPALKPTPGMIAYGVAKAAVHHLVKSIAAEKGGLPADGNAFAILPVTLDTPMNRKWMKYNDTWTPLEDVANILNGWLEKRDLPPNGSLVQLVTKDGKTELITST